MFSETLAGKGCYRIATALNEKGVPTKKNGRWTASTVRGILKNEKYTGDILFQKTYTDSQFNRHTNRGEKDMYYMEGHHPAIVSRETFEAVAAVIGQRGKEKSVTQGNKYQNRYPFSGKIICGECGSSFKRRIHYSTHQKYIAWCCSKHIEHIEDCSMQFIRQDAVEAAFMTMMNKLAYAYRRILQPLRDALRRVDDAEGFRSIEKLENRIDAVLEREQVLSGLMAKGYLEPALYGSEKNELARELEELKDRKDVIIRSLNSSMANADAVNELLKFTAKAEMVTVFDEEVFGRFVEKIEVYSRSEVGFVLKCGLTLKERLVG